MVLGSNPSGPSPVGSLGGVPNQLHLGRRQTGRHLVDEEEHILPLAARHISQAEWNELGEHGAGETKKSLLPILFGAIAEEATPEEMAHILSTVPLPVALAIASSPEDLRDL